MNHCVHLTHPSAGLLADDAAAAETDDLVVDRSYVKKKLEHGLTRIWQVRVAWAHVGTLPDPPRSITASLLSAGRPVESEGLHPGNGHVEFQIRRLHRGPGCHQQVHRGGGGLILLTSHQSSALLLSSFFLFLVRLRSLALCFSKELGFFPFVIAIIKKINTV